MVLLFHTFLRQLTAAAAASDFFRSVCFSLWYNIIRWSVGRYLHIYIVRFINYLLYIKRPLTHSASKALRPHAQTVAIDYTITDLPAATTLRELFGVVIFLPSYRIASRTPANACSPSTDIYGYFFRSI